MKRFDLTGCSMCLALMLTQAAVAQPALERLEKQLKAQDEAAPLLAPPANDPNREPGYLGVLTKDNPPPGSYIKVVEVLADGPAARAGLRVGDLIIRVQDQATRNMNELAPILQRSLVGDRLTFTVLRGRDELQLAVTLGRRPPPGERKFEGVGTLPEPSPPAGAPPGETARRPPADAGPLLVPPQSDLRKEDRARIDLLERRVAELERRLAELERLLEKRP